jgi:hypothetical protein
LTAVLAVRLRWPKTAPAWADPAARTMNLHIDAT